MPSNVNLGVTGIDANYAFHIKESTLDFDILHADQAKGLTFFGNPEDIVGGDSSQLINLMQTPFLVEKDIQFVCFYKEKAYANKSIILKGNAPLGRRVYVSITKGANDFTGEYVRSTITNELGGFSFESFSFEEDTEIAIWIQLQPTDRIANLTRDFRYWIAQETQEVISDYTITFMPHQFEAGYKRKAHVSVESTWIPSDYYQNNIFVYCSKELLDWEDTYAFLPPDSEENRVNNILYAYKIKQTGKSLTTQEKKILSKSFYSMQVNGIFGDSYNSLILEDSFEYVLAWSYFYEEISDEPSIEVMVHNSLGYIGTKILTHEEDLTDTSSSITVYSDWDLDDYPDTEFKILPFYFEYDNIDNFLDGHSYLIDPSYITNEEERDLICTKNLCLAGRMQEEGVEFSEQEALILERTSQLAPYDFKAQRLPQTFYLSTDYNIVVAWCSFYNKIPDFDEIYLEVSTDVEVPEEIERPCFDMSFYSITGDYDAYVEINFDSMENDEAAFYVFKDEYEKHPYFIQPTGVAEAVSNIYHAVYGVAQESLTQDDFIIIRRSLNILPITDWYPTSENLTDMGYYVNNGSDTVIAWLPIEEPNASISAVIWEDNPSAVCLSKDTLITMANGSTKRMDSLTKGELVLCENGSTAIERIKVTASNPYYYEYLFEGDIIIKETAPHRFYNKEQGFYQRLGKWQIGEHAINQDGQEVALLSVRKVEERELKYGLFTESGTYYANSLLSGTMQANRSFLADASIDKVINMASSVEAIKALNFIESGERQ